MTSARRRKFRPKRRLVEDAAIPSKQRPSKQRPRREPPRRPELRRGLRLMVEEAFQAALSGAQGTVDLEKLRADIVSIGRAEPAGYLGDTVDQLV